MRLFAGLFLRILTAVASTAMAQTRLPTQSTEQILEQFDDEGDGVIDEIEFRVNIIRVMGLLDTNRNGVVDRDEVALTDERFAQADRNGDGKIDGVELIETPFLGFQAFELNGDGQVTLDEILQADEKLRN